MKLKLLATWLAVLSQATVSTSIAIASDSNDTAVPVSGTGPVFIGSADLIYLESRPVQVRLVVEGALPTPCHEARWKVEHVGTSIEIRLWSETDPALECIQVLEPFDVSIALGSFGSSGSLVSLNDQAVGRVDIRTPSSPGDMLLVGAGRSFGMCAGYCNADLVIDGQALRLTAHGRTSDVPLHVSTGALTNTGLQRIDAATRRLSGKLLEPIYGCPDCADGGAAYLTLLNDGFAARHEMGFSVPPDELAELQGLAMAVIDALETCRPNALVAVAQDCSARDD